MTPINIILAVLEAIGTLVSEILYAFIIKYLQKKQLSCPFDRVCINNFIFVMFMVIYMNILFYIALFLAPIPYQPAAILHGTLDLLFIGFTATTLSTFIIKYIYVFQTKHIDDLSEKKVILLHISLTFVFITLTMILDLFDSSKTDGPLFQLLVLDPSLQR